MISCGRQKTLSGGGHVLDYLKRMQTESASFFYAIQGDNEQSGANIFWADATSRTNYNYFGDAVRLDLLYRSKNYRVPLATFTGLNHHAQPVLFGCALIFNESERSFVWLLQTWLQAMSGKCPVSLTTNLDHFIQVAVAHVLPKARHRICKWSVFDETQEKLAGVYQTHPTFEFEFKKCVSEAETVEVFESHWGSLLEKFHLVDNEWLQFMYNARHQWVPVYMRDTFFGEFSTAGGSNEVNSFFDGFVNASTTMQMLIKQYENAIASWHEKELKADYDTTHTTPILKTPSPMEKQAADLYTRRIFMKFQGELVETLANPATKIEDTGTIMTYNVAKFGEEHQAHTVRFNACEMKANCSCHMFEFSGIICRHILSVFRAKNVLTLPSLYILKRWTREAKNAIGGAIKDCASDFPSNSHESFTVRHSNLRHEAMKFVEEGAKSIHIYNVAVNALQEARKKVAAAKKKSIEATVDDNRANCSNQDMHVDKDDQATTNLSLEEKDRKIRQLAAELESTNQRCEIYRTNLLAVLKDMEDQKLKLSVKVQNARLSLRE
ncbi:hypothetical protein M9H77_19883 [Catharanthus roseus]|uniref:Uncharacterized protein n=1 Tax=Catharanthus roseus TaxID=4058 RepID=A0ACC0BBM2_CATRO|nr:hypothetical protein M9H77_19883 [Catharanthus roseus]